MDLRADLLDPPAADGEAAELVNVEHQLGAIAVARARVGSMHGRRDAHELRELDERLEKLDAALVTRAGSLKEQLDALRRSLAKVESALDIAYTCKGVDWRFPSAAPFSTYEQKRRSAFTPRTPDIEARQKRNEATLRSPECMDGGRLVAAMRTLDPNMHGSVKSVGGHLQELTFDRPTTTLRDQLVTALHEHEKNLAAFDETRRADSGGEVLRLRADLDELGNRCLERMNGPLPQVSDDGSRTARQVTVLVRPTWPDPDTGKLVPLASFGSGVLLRWKSPDGTTEARVLTNAHVMSGASSAEVVEADRVQLAADRRGPDRGSKSWLATLLRVSNDDDVAVLRVAPDAGPLPKSGPSFRLTPAKEQEPVTAAGFPGLGGRPSFQISAGAVSNASLKTSTGPFGVYVQHTAAIDPGNSGGPLFDAEGRLLGINTLKVVGRESVGLAIPAARLQLALLRADDLPTFTTKHAESLCNAFVSMLGSDEPRRELLDRLSLSLVGSGRHTVDAEISAYRTRLRGEEVGPEAAARANAYARLRAKVEAEGGVHRLAVCEKVTPSKADTYDARFSTRTGSHRLSIAPERGQLRIVAVE